MLSSSHFLTVKSFNKFVSRILSLCSAKTPLRALDFERLRGTVQPRLLQRIVKYAVSHNVQQLSISIRFDIQNFPTCLFSWCHTLTSLKLAHDHRATYEETLFPSSLDLPALATLSLESFAFCVGDDGRADPFSTFNSLNSLTIHRCRVLGAQNLCISSATLANLTLKTCHEEYGKIELSTPSLCTFVFGCSGNIPALKLHGIENKLSSVKHVEIHACIGNIDADKSLVLLNWLVELANIKSLTINHNALEVLLAKFDLRKY